MSTESRLREVLDSGEEVAITLAKTKKTTPLGRPKGVVLLFAMKS